MGSTAEAMMGMKRGVKEVAGRVLATGSGDSIREARQPRVEPGLQRKSSRYARTESPEIYN